MENIAIKKVSLYIKCVHYNKYNAHWDMLENNPHKLAKFKSDMGDRLRIATQNNASYEIFSNTPIPDAIKTWIIQKGIPFTEILD